MGVLLDIQELNVRFGTVPAVQGVSLHIDEGEALGLVGESGSGKSATALAILGLLGPVARVSGDILWRHRVRVKGKGGRPDSKRDLVIDLAKQPPRILRRIRGREIAMIFQEPMTALNPVMTIGRQVSEAAAAHSRFWTWREAKRRAIEALEAVSIPDAAERYGDYPHQFSGGQRQRIMIAMAVVNQPRLLIADEPTTALDVTVQAQVLDLLRNLRRRYKLSMLFISHDLAVVGQIADRVAVMQQGRVVEMGKSAHILTTPDHPYTRELLTAVPTMRSNREMPLARVNTYRVVR